MIERFFKAKYFIILTIFIVCLRFASIGLYDVYDNTESRYASIAMRMAKSNNFITPMIYQNKPFLAKPPLSFWVTALSIKIFDLNEFSVRLPHLLIASILLIFVFFALKKVYSTNFAAMVTMFFCATAGFFASSAMVMTEPCLIFSTTISILSFWLIINKEASLKWNYPLFVSLGLSNANQGTDRDYTRLPTNVLVYFNF
jgi:4-amino-4-deoxy-L-arabinose transferase-like glycosyltransferase